MLFFLNNVHIARIGLNKVFFFAHNDGHPLFKSGLRLLLYKCPLYSYNYIEYEKMHVSL